MHLRTRWKVALAGAASVGSLLYGAKAAAFFDFGGNALLADLLANATKQLAVATQSLAELRRSYAEVKKVSEYAEDAAHAARAFQRFSARELGKRFQSQLEAAYPDLERFRRDALEVSGMSGSAWARGTVVLQRLSTYCLADASSGKAVCAELRNELDGQKVLAALWATFGIDAAAQARAVDAEVAAALRADAAQARVSDLQKVRLRGLLRLCNRSTDLGGSHEAKRFAEECSLAAQEAQLLHLAEGQETNVKLSEIARLQALAIAQKNAELRRELAEREARRAALTDGIADLAGQRVSIRSGGLGP